MNDHQWRYIFVSVEGSSHQKSGLPCQDASDCRLISLDDGETVLIMAASDGAGSADRSDIGASLCCSMFIQEVTAFLRGGGDVSQITRDFVRNWLEAFQEAVRHRAEEDELTPRDFACTIIAAVLGHDSAVFIQVGDGVIVISPPEDPDEYCWVFWPQQGEYENTTVFATEPTALEVFNYELSRSRFDEIAILTDGLQRLALHFQTQTAYSPFFRPMFAPLRSSSPTSLDSLTASLRVFLDSKPVNDRVDDDKTLVIATRRVVEPLSSGEGGNDRQI